MLKHCLLMLMLVGLMYTVQPSAVAQDAGNKDQQSAPAGAPPEHGPGQHHFDPAQRTEMLSHQLSLTSDQQTKVQDILKSEKSQMEKIHADSSLSQEDRHSKMMDLHKSSNDQIRALLDAGQQKKWDEMQSRREQWMKTHRPGGAPDSSEKK
jgi:periplasmic protein CpxP/Spy